MNELWYKVEEFNVEYIIFYTTDKQSKYIKVHFVMISQLFIQIHFISKLLSKLKATTNFVKKYYPISTMLITTGTIASPHFLKLVLSQ